MLQTDRHQAEVRLALAGVQAGPAGRRLQPVDVERLDVTQGDVAGPVVFKVAGHGRRARLTGRVEENNRAVWVPGDHPLGRVGHLEALRHLEGEAELRMQEALAAHEALGRAVAVDQAVDLVEIEIARDDGAGDAAPVGGPDRPLDPVGGARMGLGDVEGVGRLGPAGQLGLVAAVAQEPAQEGGHGLRVVAGARQVAHAEGIGLELLVPRIAEDGELGGAGGGLGRRLAAEQHADAQRRRRAEHRLAVALGRVARRDVADLVRQDAGQLRLVVGQGQQAAGHVDIAAGQGEGVDDGRIEDGEMPLQLRQLRGPGQQVSEAVDVGPELGVVVFAAEFPDDLRVLLAAQLDLVLGRQAAGKDAAPGCRRLGAALQHQDGDKAAGGQQRTQLSHRPADRYSVPPAGALGHRFRHPESDLTENQGWSHTERSASPSPMPHHSLRLRQDLRAIRAPVNDASQGPKRETDGAVAGITESPWRSVIERLQHTNETANWIVCANGVRIISVGGFDGTKFAIYTNMIQDS